MRGRCGLDRDDEMRARDVCELLRVVWERERIYQRGSEWSSSSPWKTNGSRILGANFSFRREKEKTATENKDVMAILSNGTTIAKGRNTNLARGERAKKTPIDILSTSEAGRKEEQRVVVESAKEESIRRFSGGERTRTRRMTTIRKRLRRHSGGER